MAPLRKPVHLLALGAALCGGIEPGPKVEIGEVRLIERAHGAEALTGGRAVRATLAAGQTVQARYAAHGDQAWLLAGGAGTRIVIDARAYDATDPELAVYGPRAEAGFARTPLLAKNDDHRRGKLDARAELTLPRDGTYLVVVREHVGRRGMFTVSLGCGSMSTVSEGSCEPAPVSLGQLDSNSQARERSSARDPRSGSRFLKRSGR